MSTKTYSIDLRKRVISYLKTGKTYEEASKIFQVSVTAIGRWNRRYKSTGNCTAKQRGGSTKRIDLEKLKSYVESNPDMRLKEASKELKVSTYNVSYWLRKLGYSYKKKPSPTWKLTQLYEKSMSIK